MPCGSVAECLKTRMYTVPGPNPVVAPAASGWSATECEMAGGVFEISKNEYVLVYHCLNNTGSYNVGMSTATHPLGSRFYELMLSHLMLVAHFYAGFQKCRPLVTTRYCSQSTAG